MNKRRVVVTGLGMLSPLGTSIDASWEAAVAGKSGIGLIENFDTTDYAVKIAGAVDGFEVTDYLDKKEARRY